MEKIRLLLIEDNRLLREGILDILKPHNDIIVIAASGDEKYSHLKIQQLKPNVVLLDFGLRSQSSLHIVEIVRKDFPESKIIVMDLAPVQADILQFVKAGANGFILKDAPLDDLLNTIRSVAEGSTVLPPLLVYTTKRKREVINLLSDGMRNKEIGHKMRISTYTVKSYLHNIMEKLALNTRFEIANYSYN